jgi:radical SAM superfamily enzyme YgiQ (UPF0313 family)
VLCVLCGVTMTIGRLRLKPHGYDFPPYRPPSEANSLLLRVTRGCPWNRCTFCSMYKDMPFERRPLADILEDIEAAQELYSDVARTVFIGDSNSIVIKTEDFIQILKALYNAFPHIERVTSYARAKTLCKKPVEDLKKLREAGLNRLHVGLETGDRELLAIIHKGATPEEMVTAGLKAKEAGFEYSLYVLLGIGGEQRWEQHARGTAEVLNRIDPHFIRVRTVIPQPGSLLYEQIKKGTFRKAEHEIVLKEQKRLIESLEVTSTYLSDHLSNYIPVNGQLPEDKQAMLGVIDEALRLFRADDSMRQRFQRKDALKSL